MVLLVVAMVAALTTMRLAIHGREVAVPKFVGMTPAEAQRLAFKSGLTFSVERRFYSPQVPLGKVMSQAPDAGMLVRRGWQVRGAESLGAQRVAIPDVTGQSARAAEINIRERGLEMGMQAVAHLPNAQAGGVVAQDPPANAHDVSAPRVSVLIAAPADPPAFVMPNFVGQPLALVSADIEKAGLHVGTLTAQPAGAQGLPSNTAPTPSSGANATIIVGQSPPPGQKVTAGTVVNFEVQR
ncbi:MAG TPA: PASTA domain-containing protein [Terriglobales bacterium]|nr:PASTA domain-containing protein [Terriglobales bacterium]